MNEQNLKPFTSDQSREEAAQNGRKGGIASGAVRRERRTMREMLKKMLATQIPKSSPYYQKVSQQKLGLGLMEEPTVADLPLMGLINKAAKGSAVAFAVLRDTIGEKPQDEVGVTVNAPPVTIGIHDTAFVDRERKRQAELARQIGLVASGTATEPIEVEVDEDDDLPPDTDGSAGAPLPAPPPQEPTPTATPTAEGPAATVSGQNDAEKPPRFDQNSPLETVSGQNNPENAPTLTPPTDGTDAVSALFADPPAPSKTTPTPVPEPPKPPETPKSAPVCAPEPKPAPAPVQPPPKPQPAVSAPAKAVHVPPPPPKPKPQPQPTGRFVCIPAGFGRGRR